MSKFNSTAGRGLLAAMVGFVAMPAAASVSLDFQVAFNPTNDTHVILRATTDHYKPLPGDLQQAAVVCHRPEEMAVVFFLSQQGRVSVHDIAERRAQGSTWAELFLAYHVSNERLYLDVPEQVGPPYGKAKGHAKHTGKNRAKPLSDQEIVELVGLQLASSYYHVDPMQVIDSRRSGISYVSIHGGLYREQHPVRMQRVKAVPEDDGDDAIVIGRGGGKVKGKGKNDGSN